MKIECLKEKLTDGITKAERLTGKNLSLPILKCIFLEAKNNLLTVRATNLDLGIELTLPVKVVRPGSAALLGNVLTHVLNHIPEEKNVILEQDEGGIRVGSKATAALIKTFPHEDFPTLPKVTGAEIKSLSSDDLLRGLRSVWFSAALSSVKPELSSVYLHAEDQELVFVATDSFRLAEKRIPLKKKEEISNVLIPLKNVPELVRLLESIPGSFTLTIGTNQVAFLWDSVALVSRTIDGTFPDYKQILPKEGKTEVVALKAELVNALKLAHIFSDAFQQVTFRIAPKDKIFEIRTRNAEVGESATLVGGALRGDGVTLSFNHRYLSDAFQPVASDSVALSLDGAGKPMVVRGVSDSSFLYLVMPMNK
ncbi:DNA polymerase III subunit beta [Patescibacteria group bacterium]|nr:MAG: DNA polymerase III subunit beta [Patescibacteria group bacterium]